MAHELSNTNRTVIAGFRDLVGDRYMLTDDNHWSRRLVYYHLLKYRARILDAKLSARGETVSLLNRQTIPCIPLETADKAECPCIPASGCTFLKTSYAIPDPMGHTLTVSSVDGSINYAFVEWDRFKYKLESRMIADKTRPYFTLKDVGKGYHVYVHNDDNRKFITVTGIFEDPLSVQAFPDCEGKTDPCFRPLDQLFVLDEELLALAYDMAIQTLFPTKESASGDVFNNDQPDKEMKTIK